MSNSALGKKGINDEGGQALPASRRIRSSSPDLEIVVGDGESQRTYHHYRIILAHQSPFIDAKLASPLISDKSKVEFPDVPPEDWELMTEFLDIGGRPSRDLAQTFRLAKWFHKYDFPFARNMCDDVIQRNCFEPLPCTYEPLALKETLGKLDKNIEALAAAHEYQLTSSKEKGVIWLVYILSSLLAGQLTIDHLKTLVPIFIESDILWPAVSAILGPEVSEMESRSALVQNAFFPQLFVSKAKNHFWQEETSKWVRSKALVLEVRGADIVEANGIYKWYQNNANISHNSFRQLAQRPRHVNYGIVLAEDESAWRLVRSNRPFPQPHADVQLQSTVLYLCPMGDDSMPPMFGWLCADSMEANKAPILELRIDSRFQA